MNLDPRTVVLLTVVSTLIMSFGLFAVGRGYLAEMRGVKRWATGTLLQSIGWILLAMAGTVPDYISELGSPLIMLALALYYHALVAFNGSTYRTTWIYYVVAANVVEIYYYLLVTPTMAGRIVVASFTAAVLMFASARVLFFGSKSKAPFSHKMTGSLFAACSAILIVRGLYYMIWDTNPDQTAFEQNLIQDIAFLTFFIAAVVSPFTFILMCNDRYSASAALRTQELANKNIELEIAGQVKDQFLATMSHELRTPLNGVLGFLGQLGKTRLDEHQRDYLKTIDLSARILLGVINDILDYSKIEAGKLVIDKTEFRLRELLDENLSIFSASAAEKDLEIACIVEHEINDTLIGDSLRISQILSNLLGNAIKFTAQGRVLLEVSRLEENSRQVVLRFAVTDTGVGISEESLEHLFEPFVQADASTTRKHGGTGLGLTIARKLIEIMGGEIHVTSVLGSGTQFYFTLAFEISGTVSVVEKLPPVAKALRVLIVTPSTDIGKSIEESLSYLNISSTVSKTAIDALDLFNSEKTGASPFNAVVFDRSAEDVSLDEFLKLLEIHGKNIQVMVLRNLSDGYGYDSPGDPVVTGVITKPVKFTELHNWTSSVLSGDKAFSGTDAGKNLTELAEKSNNYLSGLNILIVDDNEINLKLMQLMVGELGSQHDYALNGLQAIEKFKQSEYSMILMDVNMPLMDGIEATRHIRTLEVNGHTPIIALTANTLPGDKERFISAGMDDYLAKPVNSAAFLKVLQKWLPQFKATNNVFATPESGKPAPVKSLLDPALGVELSMGDVNTWHIVLDLLLKELPVYLEKFSKFSVLEKTNLKNLAHRLAGSSCYCGTPLLYDAAKRLEELCAYNDNAQIQYALNEVIALIERMIKLDTEGKLKQTSNIIY